MRKRGNNVASVDVTQCSEWLDLLPENSGVYACHGTLSCVEPIQLIELAIGLESSKRPFIWVIRQGYKSDELNKLWRPWVRKWMEKEKREMEHGVLAIENNGASYINGHLIPMVDIARLLAERGVIVTVITTPKNAARFRCSINGAIKSGLAIRVEQLGFPAAEVGLPEGCETIDNLPSMELMSRFYAALSLLQQPVERMLEELKPRPSCIIYDRNFTWIVTLASKYQIPKIWFDGKNCFSLLCYHNIIASRVHECVSQGETFPVPGLPDRIELTPAQVPGFLPTMKEHAEKAMEAEGGADGVIINSFQELETEYCESLGKVKKQNVWCIGPVSLSNKNDFDKARRGNEASITDEDRCLKWLDSWPPSSRRYKKEEMEKWLKEEGFEDRIKGRGLLIRGWAPQVLILSHPSIGGFLTHCGWNSTLEGICAGVPMITWPLFSEQFMNQKLLIQILKVGVSIGVEVAVQMGEEEKFGAMVKKGDIMKAMESLMDGGDEGEDRRERAKKLAKMARVAVEAGGSSYLNITLLIEYIMQQDTSQN
ncbi:hypothetical protein Gogos_003621 [Gossypium gossypioides]|uniref:Glycosyltransferase n=1 Tax=Gossypium gossypioides TaxID=34282 RepID=A0A7J9CML7_GOSGO|nr:hypothetical protein [Gossypium gossypioides]